MTSSRTPSPFDRNVLVEAAAGTGKTTILIAEIIKMIVAGVARVPRIAALTFTEKAAGELKLRLRSELERARVSASAEELPRIEQALLELEEARVSTIHTFCADLLRERPVEAQVDPAFRVLAEAEADRLLRLSLDFWLQRTLTELPEGLRRVLRRIPRRDEADQVESLRRAVLALADWRDFAAPWHRDAFDCEEEITTLVAALHAYAEMLRDCENPNNDNLYKDTSAALFISDELRRREAIGERDDDYLEARLIDLLHRPFTQARGGRTGRFGPLTKRADVRRACDGLLFQLRSFEARANADLAAQLREELRGAIEQYEEQKRRIGALDFVDLLLRVRDLLRTNSEVLRHFQDEITHIFVDEFQDTDPIQVEILTLLSSDLAPGKLFLVGDPKQSIYRFRRADIGMYASIKERLRKSGAEIRNLSTSYRSVPEIQNFVNAAFRKVMNGDTETQQADFVPLGPHRQGMDRPALVALPVPKPYGFKGITDDAVEESLPDVVAAYVEWLLNSSGWGIKPQDICILFRRFEKMGVDVTRKYVQSLEARGIAQLLVGGKSFHGREEIETIRTALSAIEWPDDQLSLYATLHGSLFGITDEELLEYRHLYRRLSPFAIPPDVPDHLRPIANALLFIVELHRSRNYRPVADTLRRLFTETRCHAGFVLRPSGKQVLANAMQLMEQARVYDESGALSFRGFVNELLDEAEYGRASEAPVLEEGSEGVRLMTVHKAKGLEFPIVILADITCNDTRDTASRFVDARENLAAMEICGLRPVDVIRHEEEEVARERAEAIRVAYVAATRARDLLVVPAVADQRLEGKWLSVLNDALYPTTERILRSGFGNEPTHRPYDFIHRGDDAVKPGDYRFDGYTVTWWDPFTLRLDVPIALGIPQQELLGKEAPPGLIEQDIRNYESWRSELEAVVQTASAPSIRVETAIEHSSRQGDVPDIEVVVAGQHERSSGGLRYGTLVHAVLSMIDLAATKEEIRRAAESHARIVGAPDAEVQSVTALVENLLAHPLIKRASKSGAVRREVPLTLNVDGELIEGVADLAFEEAGHWTVIDFKTDFEIEGRLDMYKRQVGIYVRAISARTGSPATGVLVQV
jgi:ATP-dependent helicase/nuclease subunit A